MTKIPGFKVPRSSSRNILVRKLKKPRPTKPFTSTKTIECLVCEGSGKNPNNSQEVCVDCKGQGKIKATIAKE